MHVIFPNKAGLYYIIGTINPTSNLRSGVLAGYIISQATQPPALTLREKRPGDEVGSLPVGCLLFSIALALGVIFTRARVSLALLSVRKNGGLLVVSLRKHPFLLALRSWGRFRELVVYLRKMSVVQIASTRKYQM